MVAMDLRNDFYFHSGEPLYAAICNNILFFYPYIFTAFPCIYMGSGPFFNNEVIKNKYVWYSVIASIVVLIGVTPVRH